MISIRREVREEIVKRLLSKLEYYKALSPNSAQSGEMPLKMWGPKNSLEF